MTHISSFMFKAPHLPPVDYNGLKEIVNENKNIETIMVIDKITERIDRNVPVSEVLIKYG